MYLRQRLLLRIVVCGLAVMASALGASTPTYAEEPEHVGSSQPSDGRIAFENALPPSVAETVDVNVWGWLSYLHDSESGDNNYGLADIAIGGTKSFGDRLALSADMHFIDDNRHTSGFLEQAFVTAVVSPQHETLLTIGKFNASFGVEPRNTWDRLTGTPSLLFGAQPQDLIGVMITQSIGDTDFTIRPFLASNFEGHFNFDQPPSAGITTEYHRNDSLRIAVTNWIGPGVVPLGGADDDYDEDDYVTESWRGPDLYDNRAGVLYFLDGKVQWLPRPDLTLAAEALVAVSDRADKSDWSGVMLLANFDITDRLRVFGRWSFLDDAQSIVTGITDHRHELSAGAGYRIIYGLELRGEYRHDFTEAGDLDSVSLHLTFGY